MNDHGKFCRCAECERERGHGGHARPTGVLVILAVLSGLGWLLSASAAAGCSVAGQLAGQSCVPLAADFHTGAGWVALVCLAGGVLATVTGRGGER